MKKSKTEVVKIAKTLFLASFTNARLDHTKVGKNIEMVKKAYKTYSIDILRTYLVLLKRSLASETLLIEATDKIQPAEIEELRNYFEKQTGKGLQVQFRENPALLGGLQIKVADNQWDFSVKEKINQLKGKLLNG